MQTVTLGKTGLELSPIVVGTGSLGNLYQSVPHATKLEVLRKWFELMPETVVIDTAGKYGAGLALEEIGLCLTELDIDPKRVVISNKLGWKRVPLTTPEQTFEPGAWVDLKYDAEQHISYDGILDCWQQGCELLAGVYHPQMVSVHDPDEYLAAASDERDRGRRMEDIRDAYRALIELRERGDAQGVGVGSKDWRVIETISREVDLDWVMIANSLTIMEHPPELLAFVEKLAGKGIGVINSAVFHAGFLVGGEFFDYRELSPDDPEDAKLFAYRDKLNSLCEKHNILPAAACVQFGCSVPGVASVALSSSNPDRVEKNLALVNAAVPAAFWQEAKSEGLIDAGYPYLG